MVGRCSEGVPGRRPRTAAQCLNGQMEAMDWLREQGVVLQSARGPVPNLAEEVAGERIRGSWWGHPSGHEIFNVLDDLLASPDVVATRLVNGRVTLIHRRVWPALVRLAGRFPLSGSQPSTRCTRRRGLTARSRCRSPSGSPPKTSRPRPCSPSTRRWRCFRPACADIPARFRTRSLQQRASPPRPVGRGGSASANPSGPQRRHSRGPHPALETGATMAPDGTGPIDVFIRVLGRLASGTSWPALGAGGPTRCTPTWSLREWPCQESLRRRLS